MRRLTLLWALGVSVGAPSLAGAVPAKGQDARIETVRYSYTKWSRGGSDRYVMVPISTRVTPGTLPDRTRALFKLLVGSKRGSYGDARLAFQGDAEQTGVIYVYLDKSKAAYHPIVMAETTYTFTENGASRVIFPKFKAQGWTRDEVPFPAYELVLPLWQVLPPASVGGALVRLPGGRSMRVEAATEALKGGDAALIEAMWGYLSAGPKAASLAALRAAPLLNLSDLSARLLPVLEAADVDLRRAALEGLAGLDEPTVNEALRAVMDADAEPALRDLAAGQLSKSKDPAFSTAALYHALRSADPEVVRGAAVALGESHEAEATARLEEIVGHADAGVRAAAISSLVKRGDLKVLRGLLSAPKLDAAVRLDVAKALTGVKPRDSQRAGLCYLAVQGADEEAAGAAAALATFDEPDSYEALGAALKHKAAVARRAAASALSRMADVRGLPLLSAADVEDPDSGPALLNAIRAIYAKQPLDFVLKGTRDKRDAVLRRSAVATLGAMVRSREGKRNRRKIAETLSRLGEDKEPLIRASAVRSFEAMAGEDVRPEVVKRADDEAIEVQRALAHALRAFPGAETVKTLLRFARSEDPVLLANAVESLGLLKEREALDPIISRLNHKDTRVRRAATIALVSLGGTLEQRGPLLSFFSERLFDQDPEIRRQAIKGLGLVNDPRTVTAMAPLIQDPVLDIRIAAVFAMADTGDQSAVEGISSALEDDDAGVRKAAIDALLRLKHRDAVPVLKKFTEREKDAGLLKAARDAIATLRAAP